MVLSRGELLGRSVHVDSGKKVGQTFLSVPIFPLLSCPPAASRLLASLHSLGGQILSGQTAVLLFV